jgi:hypothetical protein
MKAKTNAKAIEAGLRPQPPKTIFLPTKRLLRIMIRAVLLYGEEDPDTFCLRFGLSEFKKIQY